MGKSFFERLFSPFFLLAIHLHPVEDGEFSLFYMLIFTNCQRALSPNRVSIFLRKEMSIFFRKSPFILFRSFC